MKNKIRFYIANYLFRFFCVTDIKNIVFFTFLSNWQELKFEGIVGIDSDIPNTFAPSEHSHIDSQLPLKPV